MYVLNIFIFVSKQSMHRCFAHVINLGVVDVMGEITQVAVIETTTAIWEFDPDLPGNRIMGGLLDVIAALRTLAVKVCLSLLHLSDA